MSYNKSKVEESSVQQLNTVKKHGGQQNHTLMISLQDGMKLSINFKNLKMKNLSINQLQEINGGCATCRKVGKAAKKAWNHVSDFFEGFFEGI